MDRPPYCYSHNSHSDKTPRTPPVGTYLQSKTSPTTGWLDFPHPGAYLVADFLTLPFLLTFPSHLSTTPEFRCCFYLRENWTHGETARSSLLATTDCQPRGRQASINFTISAFLSIWPGHSNPAICFVYDQTHPNCRTYGVQTNGGCPYTSCKMRKARLDIYGNQRSRYRFTTDGSSAWYLTIPYPWDPRWATGVEAKLYTWPSDSYPTASLPIYWTCVRNIPQNPQDLQSQSLSIQA
ncbi:putative endogenous retrovirus group FC1 Env polyprotein [Neovison vison]|uniref:putative endogenous retrovirus group FC1 Env polyprotein n=1 Tax=Neovison vison TaxID=452646 RepID=UPI001CF0ABD1|nr:putative endogenous retrovirus group FC1 Env polyprotein [Neogale vison]